MTEEATVVTSSRFSQWAAYLVFSTISFLSTLLVAYNNGDLKNQTPQYELITIICTAIIFGLNVLIVIIHLISKLAAFFVGKKLEGFFSFCLMVLWIVVVIIVTDPKHGLSVDPSGSVSNGNLYYFSWAGFVCGVILFVSYLRSAFGVDLRGELRSRAARLNLWAALLATSLVVTGTAANYFVTNCNPMSNAHNTCARTIFAISLGSLTVALALVVIIMKVVISQVSLTLESFISAFLVISYIFGIGTITTALGPGAALGNLYYFTWFSFLLSFMISTSCTEDRKTEKSNEALASNDHHGASSSTTLGADRNMWIA